MNRIHIIGRKNHGKTQLVVDLVEEFARRGIRVGTVKHTHHRHELDVPGKDSHRHRMAGAAAVGIVSQTMIAAFLPVGKQPPGADRYDCLTPLFSDCQMVLVEGDTMSSAPKVEVWRAEVGTTPIAAENHSVLAIVTDDQCDLAFPLLPRSNVVAIADWILDTLKI